MLKKICLLIALVLALGVRGETILDVVAFAWAGFGAAFGPLILFALYSRRTSWQAALAGMITGTVVLAVWKQIGLGAHVYEIVPGFAANCLAIMAANRITRQTDPRVLRQFDEVANEVTGHRGALAS